MVSFVGIRCNCFSQIIAKKNEAMVYLICLRKLSITVQGRNISQKGCTFDEKEDYPGTAV